MKPKHTYIVEYYQDRGPYDYEFFTEKELVESVSFYNPYVRIYKIEKELTKKDAEKLGLEIID